VRRPPLPADEVIRLLNEILENGRVKRSPELPQRMRERNFRWSDVIKVLESATPEAVEPRWHERRREWRYRISGEDT